MGNLAVVVGYPLLCALADLAERAKHMHIQDAAPIAAVEAFDEAFCIGRPGSMKSSVMPLRSAHSASASATNSGPLSRRSLVG